MSEREILVVDDDEDIREILCVVLQVHGYHATAVADGQTALDKLRNHYRAALILLDMLMPGLSGADLMKALKNDPALAPIPVVVMSGDHTACDTAAALGAAACLIKPVEMDQLVQVVERHAISTEPTMS